MYTGHLTYDLWVNTLWMGWNTFLAVIPFVLAKRLFRHEERINVTWIVGFFFFMLFLPNAPYIFTDSIHWYSTFIRADSRFAFSILSLQFLVFLSAGYWLFAESYRSFEAFIRRKYDVHHYFLRLVTFGILSVGVFLGRFLRLNSWDVFTQPKTTLLSLKIVMQPHNLAIIFGFTVLLSFLYFLYDFFVWNRQREK